MKQAFVFQTGPLLTNLRHPPVWWAHKKTLRILRFRRVCSARSTGLEPATSGVTGRCSNQLSYDPSVCLQQDYVRSGIRRYWPKLRAGKAGCKFRWGAQLKLSFSSQFAGQQVACLPFRKYRNLASTSELGKPAEVRIWGDWARKNRQNWTCGIGEIPDLADLPSLSPVMGS